MRWSAGISTGGGIGGQFAGNMANGMLAGLNDSGSADSTTKSAVSEGTIVIRDKEKQTQDVADLSRDVANANPGLDVIFDKEKEQNRLKVAQLIGEIGSQVGDIARTQGQIIATREANEKISGATQTDRDRALAELKAKDPTKQYSASDVNKQVYSNYYNQAFVESGFGTGGKVQQAISALTAAVQGLSGGNVAQALSGAASPYLAEQIHKLTEGNPEAQAMAHAVVGAVASYAFGNNALAGAAGGVSGELMAGLVMKQLYPGKTVGDLSETEKQTISALGTLAAGLAGGVAGDSTADIVAGAQAGKNAVENNALHAEGEKQRQDAKWSLPYLEAEKKQQAEKLISDLNAKDKAFDAALDSACKGLSSAACQGMRQELAAMSKSYDQQLDGQYIGTMGSVYKEGKGQVDALMWQYASADAKAEREANVNRIAENWGVSKETADGLYTAMAGVHTTAAIGGAVYGMKGSSSAQTGKNPAYIEEPPFNPSGTGGAAQPWSSKGRINYVQLPNEGKIRYIPPEGYSASQPLPRGPNKGYIDKFGNEWVKGPSRTAGQAFEWDVQLSRTGKAQLGWATRDGSHLNISLDGKVTHK